MFTMTLPKHDSNSKQCLFKAAKQKQNKVANSPDSNSKDGKKDNTGNAQKKEGKSSAGAAPSIDQNASHSRSDSSSSGAPEDIDNRGFDNASDGNYESVQEIQRDTPSNVIVDSNSDKDDENT